MMPCRSQYSKSIWSKPVERVIINLSLGMVAKTLEVSFEVIKTIKTWQSLASGAVVSSTLLRVKKSSWPAKCLVKYFFSPA